MRANSKTVCVMVLVSCTGAMVPLSILAVGNKIGDMAMGDSTISRYDEESEVLKWYTKAPLIEAACKFFPLTKLSQFSKTFQ